MRRHRREDASMRVANGANIVLRPVSAQDVGQPRENAPCGPRVPYRPAGAGWPDEPEAPEPRHRRVRASVRDAKDHAAGPTAVAVSMKRAVEQMGVRRAMRTLLRLNQVDGFDCQGCAWPDPAPGHRHTAEFCENGAKAVTEEATRRHIGREFFAAHPLTELGGRPTTGWVSRAGSPSRWCCGPGHATTSRSPGRRRSPWSPSTSRAGVARTRRSSTPPARPPTRRRSSTSSSPGPSAPTTCPTARTCATSRRRWRLPR